MVEAKTEEVRHSVGAGAIALGISYVIRYLFHDLFLGHRAKIGMSKNTMQLQEEGRRRSSE